MLALLGALAACASSASAVPPSNDQFSAATVVPAGGLAATIDTTDATAELGEPNHFTAASARHTAWYRWTAPITGPVRAKTSNSSFDTVLAVYAGTSLGSLVRIRAGDDSPMPGDSWNSVTDTVLVWQAQAGTTYSIAIDGASAGAFGTTTLHIGLPGPGAYSLVPRDGTVALTPDEFSATYWHDNTGDGRTAQLQFEVCSTPPGTTACAASGGTLVASGSSAANLDEGSAGTWQPPALALGTYYWHVRAVDDTGMLGAWSQALRFDITPDVPATPVLVAPGAGAVENRRPQLAAIPRHPRDSAMTRVEFELCSVAPTPAQTCVAAGGVVRDIGTSTPAIAPNDEPATRTPTNALPVGTTYWRARTIDEVSLTSGWSAARAVATAGGPSNDDFADATPLTGTSVLVSGSNVAATLESGEPNPLDDSHSIWFDWTATSTGTARFATCSDDFDSTVAVFTGASVNALTLLDADDFGCSNSFSGEHTRSGGVVQVPVTVGTTYRVRVGGMTWDDWDAAEPSDVGTVKVTVDESVPPAHDDLATALVLDPWNDSMSTNFVGATREPGEPTSLSGLGNPSGSTVWYEWTAPVDMAATIRFSSMTADVDVGIFTGSTFGTLSRVGGRIIQPYGDPATWNAVAGTTYRIGLQAANSGDTQTLRMPSDTWVDAPYPIYDGLVPSVDVNEQSSTTALNAHWKAVADSPAGVVRYETCFSTDWDCSGTVLQGWTSVGLATSHLLTGQTLVVGTTYVACVRAVDAAGNESSYCSNGVKVVAPKLPSTPVQVAPEDAASGPVSQQLSARFEHPDFERTGTIEFQTCSDSLCTVVLESGTSAGGLRPGSNGTWAPSGLATGTTIYWRTRAMDDLLLLSGWSPTWQLDVVVPPANDQFVDARTLIGAADSHAGTNVNASVEPGESRPFGTSSRSVWYSWTAPSTGLVTIDMCTSDFDTALTIYTGSDVGALTLLSSSDDACGQGSQIVDLPVQVDTTYRIRASGYGTAAGTFTLNLSLTSTTPPNDDIANAQVLTGLTSSTKGSNSSASAEPLEPASFSDPGSVWYSWTAPVDGQLAADVCTSTFNTTLAIFTGTDAASLTSIASNDDACGSGSKLTSIPVSVGTTYLVRVAGASGAIGAFTLQLALDVPVPANDNFDDATVLTGASATIRGTNIKATKQAYEYSPTFNATTHTVWYSWTPPTSGLVTADLCESDFDTTLELRSGTSISSNYVIASNDDGCASGTGSKIVDARVAPGRSYRFRVGGRFASTPPGTFVLNLAFTPDPPTANDAFADSIELIGVTDSRTGNNRGATIEPGEANPRGDSGSVWYHWTPPSDGFVSVELCSDEYRPRTIDMYTGSTVSGLSAVTRSTTTCYPQAFVDQPVVGGTRYAFRVSHDGTAFDNFTIDLAFNTDSAPSNDDFDDAFIVNGVRSATVGTTRLATAQPGEPKHHGSGAKQSVWYTWVAPFDMTADARITSTDSETHVVVYTGGALGALTQVAASSSIAGSGASWAAVGGTTYRIVVDVPRPSATPGEFELLVNLGHGSYDQPAPLDGPDAGVDINEQTDTTQLSATWAAATDPYGLLTGYETCISEDAGTWASCSTPWRSVGLVTSTVEPLVMNPGDDYSVCVRAVSSDGYVTDERCSTGVDIVAALSDVPPPPTLIAPRARAEVATLPVLVASLSFNQAGDRGSVEFEVYDDECVYGDLLESGSYGPGLASGDTASFTTTVEPPTGDGCWRARTVSDTGATSSWSRHWEYTVVDRSMSIEVESAQVSAGGAFQGRDAATSFTVSLDTSSYTGLFVNDESATDAATCTCSAVIRDVPLEEQPQEWPIGDHPGTAGLTVLNAKGAGVTGRSWIWGDAPAHGASLDDLEASAWIGVPGPSTPYLVAEASRPVDVTLGYRIAVGATQEIGRYSTKLTFTAIPMYDEGGGPT